MSESRPTILLVDDNPQIRSFIKPALEVSGFDCVEAADGDVAVYQAEATHPDLIVLDIELGDPTMDGLDTCKQIRTLGLTMPVIFLSVRERIEDLESGLRVAGPGSDYVRKLEELRWLQVEGHESGGVDIAIKAPDTRELIARIRARLPSSVRQLGPDLRLDRKARSVEQRVGQTWTATPLQPLEYDVFETLVDADRGVVGTWQLYNLVFQHGSPETDALDDSTVDNYKNRVWVCIANLRKKLRAAGERDYIETVHGIGYRLRVRGE